ncbi:hypothetical protein VP01_235g1 [Puccinia sorghi]|uniref:Uncharacterized protein n=1 Tax=Puccinia sorghi TaxID=27349 RepID=A0A0L6V7D1_9BASI|nr:hypothetical protein VP01_235g1 [Puccinia sorghi]
MHRSFKKILMNLASSNDSFLNQSTIVKTCISSSGRTILCSRKLQRDPSNSTGRFRPLDVAGIDLDVTSFDACFIHVVFTLYYYLNKKTFPICYYIFFFGKNEDEQTHQENILSSLCGVDLIAIENGQFIGSSLIKFTAISNIQSNICQGGSTEGPFLYYIFRKADTKYLYHRLGGIIKPLYNGAGVPALQKKTCSTASTLMHSHCADCTVTVPKILHRQTFFLQCRRGWNYVGSLVVELLQWCGKKTCKAEESTQKEILNYSLPLFCNKKLLPPTPKTPLHVSPYPDFHLSLSPAMHHPGLAAPVSAHFSSPHCQQFPANPWCLSTHYGLYPTVVI